MSTIRVLVVEDSLTVRKRIVEVLSADHDIEVVGETGSGVVGLNRGRGRNPGLCEPKTG